MPKPSIRWIAWWAMLASPSLTFATNQITAPAGAAKMTARHRTISVRSMIDV